MKPAWKTILSLGLALLIGSLALWLRLRAVERLPIDFDEDDYLGAAQRYAAFLRQGDLNGLIDYDYNQEHPPLSKLAYGVALLPLPESALLPELSSSRPPAARLPEPHFQTARRLAAVLGSLQTVALALLNPLAGLFLAAYTWQIKYTSQVMLEPLPSLLSALSALAYLRSLRSPGSQRQRNGWLAISALALGLTAAAKFTYCVVGLAILADWLWRTRPPRPGLPHLVRWLAPALGWGLLALLCFFASNPRLWHEPGPRLVQMVAYHGDYAQSDHVRQAGFPPWQPFVWLSQSVPWHPGVFLVSLDALIGLLAVIGLARLWRQQRSMALWLLIGLAFLLIWPTKWPQYLLTLTFPLCLAAAEGLQTLVLQPLRRLWLGWRQPAADDKAQARIARREARLALPWVLPGLLVLLALTLFPLLFQLAMSLTDFSALSIRDGLQGGVWRAVWQGLTGQQAIQPLAELGQRANSRTVQYLGPQALLALLSGGMSETLIFTTLWTVLSVALQTALGLGAALLLNQAQVRLRRFWQGVFILPWAIPEFIGALIWYRIFTPRYGWLMLATTPPGDALRGATPPVFESPGFALFSLLIAALWYGFPFMMVASLAALKFIPPSVRDAAAIDGAVGWKKFQHLTGPMILPLLAPAILIRTIFAFNQFYLFYAMQPPYPLLTFATISFYFFSPTGPFGGNFAISAAINIFTVLVLIGLVLWFNKISKAAEGVTYA